MSLVLVLWSNCFLWAAIGFDTHVLAESEIQTDGDALSVEVEADGHRLRLMLDTGSPGLQLDSEHILGRVNGKLTLSNIADGSAPFQLPIPGPKSLRFSNVQLQVPKGTFACNLIAVRNQITRPAQGIIGLDPFKDYVLEFDWDRKKLRVRNSVPDDLVDWVPFSRGIDEIYFPNISGEVLGPNSRPQQRADSRREPTEEERLKAAFEDGDDRHSMRFILASNWPSYQDAYIASSDARVLRNKGLMTICDARGKPLAEKTEHKDFLYLLKNLRFGEQFQENVFVQSVPQNKVNVLPVAWMLRYHLAIDMPNKRLYLGPRKTPPPPFKNPNLTGLQVVCNMVPRNGDPGKIYVSEVKPGSVAEKAGLARLDRILEFNDLEIGQFRPYEILLAQQLPNTKHKMRVLRGLGNEFVVTIQVPSLPE